METFKEVKEEKRSKKSENVLSLMHKIESKHIGVNAKSLIDPMDIETGDIIRIGYKIPEGEKERIQFYEGLVIARQNRTLSQTVTMRRNVEGIGVEQIFLLHSPKIASLIKKQSSKVRRSKLYFMRQLQGKATRLKIKR